mgnify:CR=1 FL=1
MKTGMKIIFDHTNVSETDFISNPDFIAIVNPEKERGAMFAITQIVAIVLSNLSIHDQKIAINGRTM